MRIAEIFSSNQGEGLLSGTPSVFVRTSGCNLRCWFCDTRYASWEPEGDDLSVEQIVEQVGRHPAQHVVLTGGEPMLFAELVPLTEQLEQQGRHITIETAGTLDLPVVCHLMSISPKLSNSTPDARELPGWAPRHEQTRERPAVIRRLLERYPHQLKFVIDRPEDVAEAVRYLCQFPGVAPERVLLMPQGTDPQQLAEIGRWLEPQCRELGVTYCPRRHIEWFGSLRGT